MNDNPGTTMTAPERTAILHLSEHRAPRRRRGLPALTAAVLAVTGVAVSAFVLDAQETRTVRSAPSGAVPTTATTAALATATTAPGSATATTAPTPAASTATTRGPVTTTPPPPVTVPERLTSASRLRLDGVGPVRIGMTLGEATAAAGVPIQLMDMPPGPECRYAVPDRASGTGDELAFMVVDGRIVRIDVGIMGPDRIRTLSGIGKGSTEAEVHATYPGRIDVRRHPYIAEGRYLVYVPGDPGLRHLSLIFETVNGEVRSFRAGLAEQVSWKEGCS